MEEYMETSRFRHTDPAQLELLEKFLKKHPPRVFPQPILSKKTQRNNFILTEVSEGLFSGVHQRKVYLSDEYPEAFWHEFSIWEFQPKFQENRFAIQTLGFLQEAYNEARDGEKDFFRGLDKFRHNKFDGLQYSVSLVGNINHYQGYEQIHNSGELAFTQQFNSTIIINPESI